MAAVLRSSPADPLRKGRYAPRRVRLTSSLEPRAARAVNQPTRSPMWNDMNPMDEAVLERLKTEIADLLGVDESMIVPEARFVTDLGADSLDCVELLIIVETNFGCQISDEEAENMITFGDLVELVEKKAGRKSDPRN